ncbi:MAG: DUF1501 domain-containing protein [Gemmataceae bacterium]
MFALTRRDLLKSTSTGFGYLAFAAMAHEAAGKDGPSPVASPKAGPLSPKPPHFPARAKRVIFLCMDGGPSHVDTFDEKPKLKADDGKAYSKGRIGGSKLFASPFAFKHHGQSGLPISELFPHLAKRADDLCLLNGMQTDLPNHPQAFLQMHCGIFQSPRPSMGAWALYGLGTENANLPGYVTVNPPAGNGGPANYGSSFLPAIYQGTRIGSAGRQFAADAVMVANLRNNSQSTAAQRQQLDYMQTLNSAKLAKDGQNPSVEGLIESYELAFRMQAELPKYTDFSKESKDTLASYGIGDTATESFGRQCLLARRLAEAGVRFIEVTLAGWDQHRNLKADLTKNCTAIDKPISGLLADLKQRGMLKDTLVIWGGEFGRTPTSQFGGDGRDHNAKGFSMWMAGGGVKGGFRHGKTDDYGFEAVDGKMHIHDWHATMLHLMGLNHERLTYKYAGREMRLTDIKGSVVKEIIA